MSGFYYVTAIDTADRFARLRGPFADHASALAAVDAAQAMALELCREAAWWSYGTAKDTEDRGPGALDVWEKENATA